MGWRSSSTALGPDRASEIRESGPIQATVLSATTSTRRISGERPRMRSTCAPHDRGSNRRSTPSGRGCRSIGSGSRTTPGQAAPISGSTTGSPSSPSRSRPVGRCRSIPTTIRRCAGRTASGLSGSRATASTVSEAGRSRRSARAPVCPPKRSRHSTPPPGRMPSRTRPPPASDPSSRRHHRRRWRRPQRGRSAVTSISGSRRLRWVTAPYSGTA